MVELLQLLEAGIVVTAVTLSAMTLPMSIITETEIPDIAPLLESVEDITK